MNLKLSWLIHGVLALFTVVAALFAVRAVTRDYGVRFEEERPRLDEALRLPWSDFLPATEQEQRIIRDLSLDKPLFQRDVRAWRELSSSGMFAYRPGRTRDQFVEALGLLQRMEDDTSLSRSEARSLFQRAERLLTSADRRDRNRWATLYNLGVLYLWFGQERAAMEYLDRAESVINQLVQAPPENDISRRRVLEAGILTQYALAHIRFPQERTRDRGLLHFREAVRRIGSISNDGRLREYESLPSGKKFFDLIGAQLNTRVLWNDLIAAYLATKNFHQQCSGGDVIKPTDIPDCDAIDTSGWQSDCPYRDKVLCRSLLNAEAPYTASYERLFERYFSGAAWDDEHLLWAYSNIIDVNIFNPSLGDDPALLFNTALVLTQLGEFRLAAEQVRRAEQSPFTKRLTDRHIDRLRGDQNTYYAGVRNLRILLTVLIGEPLTGAACAGAKRGPGLLRQTFTDLYSDPVSFPDVSACFPQPEEAIQIDNWLFINRWRGLLEKGDFVTFNDEYQAFMNREQPFKGVLEAWRGEVFDRIGERALAERERVLGNQEYQKAELIEDFLNRSGYFSGQIIKDMQPSLGQIFTRLRPALVSFLVLGICLYLWLEWTIRHRALQKTFRSFHRESRMLDQG